MSKKIHIASRGMGNIDKDGNITDFKLLSYDLVTPPKRTLFRRIFDFFKKFWNPNKFPNWKDDIPTTKPFPKPTGKLFYIDFKYENQNKDE